MGHVGLACRRFALRLVRLLGLMAECPDRGLATIGPSPDSALRLIYLDHIPSGIVNCFALRHDGFRWCPGVCGPRDRDPRLAQAWLRPDLHWCEALAAMSRQPGFLPPANRIPAWHAPLSARPSSLASGAAFARCRAAGAGPSPGRPSADARGPACAVWRRHGPGGLRSQPWGGRWCSAAPPRRRPTAVVAFLPATLPRPLTWRR